MLRILLCQTGRRIPFFGGSVDNANKRPGRSSAKRNRHISPGLRGFVWFLHGFTRVLQSVTKVSKGEIEEFWPRQPGKRALRNPTMYVEEIFRILGKPTDDTWPGLCKLPLFKTYNSPKISAARQQKHQGDERPGEIIHL